MIPEAPISVNREVSTTVSRCTIEVSARSPVSRATGLLGVFRQFLREILISQSFWLVLPVGESLASSCPRLSRLRWAQVAGQPLGLEPRVRVWVGVLLSLLVSFCASSVPELHRSGRSHHLGDCGCRCYRHRPPDGCCVLHQWPGQGTHVTR